MPSITEQLQESARAFTGTAGTVNEDLLAALRLLSGRSDGHISELLAWAGGFTGMLGAADSPWVIVEGIAAAKRNQAALYFIQDSLGNVFQDSVGSTPPALNAPIGLLLDSAYGASTLGPELCSLPSFQVISGGGFSASVGTLQSDGSTGQINVGSLVIGKTYRITGTSTGPLNLYLGSSTYFLGAQGYFSYVGVCSGNTMAMVQNTVAGAKALSNLKICEVIEPSSLYGSPLAQSGVSLNGNTDNGGGSYTVSGGIAIQLRHYVGLGDLVNGAMYECSVRVTAVTGTPNLALDWCDQGAVSFSPVAGSTYKTRAALQSYDSTFRFFDVVAYGAGTVTYDSVTIRRVYGNHASQSTAASRPTLTRVPRKLGPNLLTVRSPLAANDTCDVVIQPFAGGKTYVIEGAGAISWYDGTGVYPISTYRKVVTPSVAIGRLSLYNQTALSQDLSGVTVREVLEWSYAMNFDGADDRLQTAFNVPASGTLIAAAVHTPRNGSGTWQTLIGNRGQIGAPGVRLRTTDVSPLLPGLDASASGVNKSADAGANAEYFSGSSHVTSGSYDSSTMKLSSDGILVASNSGISGIPTTYPVMIGALTETGNDSFLGQIAFAFVAPSVLSDADLRTVERMAAYLVGVQLL